MLLAQRFLSAERGGRGGVVVNTGSNVGITPYVSLPIYSATKSAIISLTRAFGVSISQREMNVRSKTMKKKFCHVPLYTFGKCASFTRKTLHRRHLVADFGTKFFFHSTASFFYSGWLSREFDGPEGDGALSKRHVLSRRRSSDDSSLPALRGCLAQRHSLLRSTETRARWQSSDSHITHRTQRKCLARRERLAAPRTRISVAKTTILSSIVNRIYRLFQKIYFHPLFPWNNGSYRKFGLHIFAFGVLRT